MRFDYVLVGGGLQNALIALAVLAETPSARVALVERGSVLGGNHCWSFHAGDVPEEARAIVEPLVVRRWPRWEVSFPGFSRTFELEYASTDSTRLHDVVSHALSRRGCALLLDTSARAIGEHDVVLDDGRTLQGRLVVDARGPDRADPGPSSGYQKFVGLELALSSPLSFDVPRVMDACVAQTDGYRFFYALPFSPHRVLLEDTYFSDHPRLDVASVRAEVIARAAQMGLVVESIVREESGVLPLPTRLARPSEKPPLAAGYAGGFFHPTTGYSFPVALRLALHVARHAPEAALGSSYRALVDRHERQVRFALLLNRLLFQATPPEHRRDVLERFHRLPEETVRRFYALDTRAIDRARIVCGRPPRGVSLRAALASMVSS